LSSLHFGNELREILEAIINKLQIPSKFSQSPFLCKVVDLPANYPFVARTAVAIQQAGDGRIYQGRFWATAW
jgi:hypothetical protein